MSAPGMSLLTRDPIQLDRLIARVGGPARGGIATFFGIVRDHQDGRTVSGLEYSAYEPMAEAECARILAEASAQWPVTVTLEHRLGRLAIGDIAVAIAAAADHRAASFDACRYVIEQVKRRVPIWKREDYADGSSEWVDPTRSGARPEFPVDHPVRHG
ncbi:MAG: molybdenum cofactor biosynthesis protein MoaE [Gemmatimonadales bacterium]